MNFEELGLSLPLLHAAQKCGYQEPTPIQAQAIPLLLEGKDVIGRSHTGTGKTAAFSLPIIENMLREGQTEGVYGLVLCPTRELAMQACEEIQKFAAEVPQVHPVAVYGGAPIPNQIRRLKEGANLVIGTPGRVLDHMGRRTLKLDNLRTIVLDEADEMLSMGFREDIEQVLAGCPDQRQTVLFSATMPEPILELTTKYQRDPVMVQIGSAARTVETAAQYSVQVPPGRKTDALQLLLLKLRPHSAMIFCNTKKMVDELSEELNRRGFAASGLHGDMQQLQRTQVMHTFKKGRSNILIATDVAARGIDVQGVDAVFNYDLPSDREYYIHRIGRTGRAGQEGCAYTLISGRKEEYALRQIEHYTKANITPIAIPTALQLREEAIAAEREKLFSLSMNEISEEAAALTNELVESGAHLRAVLSALIEERLQNATRKLPTFDVPQVKPRKRTIQAEGTMARLRFSGGRRDRLAPNHIVAAITGQTGLTGDRIGKINIYDQYSLVEVPAEEMDYIVDALHGLRIGGRNIQVRAYTEYGDEKPMRRRSTRRGADRSRGIQRSRSGRQEESYRKHGRSR